MRLNNYMAKISFFTVDRSITVNHLNGGFLSYFPDFIAFSIDHDHLNQDLYYLSSNRLHHKKEEVPFTGTFTGTYCGSYNQGPYIKLKMSFKFEDGLLRDRDLISFDMS